MRHLLYGIDYYTCSTFKAANKLVVLLQTLQWATNSVDSVVTLIAF